MKVWGRRQAGLWALGALPVAILLGRQLPFLWQLAGQRLPQWDMAKYGVSGLRLAGAAATFDLPGLLRELNALSVWPPLFPLLEAPFFLVFGKEVAVAGRLVTALWAATLLLLPWALAPLAERRSPAPGWLAAAALASGTLYGSFATQVMLEIPGLFLLVLALGCSLRALRGEPNAWRAAYLAGTLLFFCKYNYGLLFLAPLLLFRLRQGFAEWSDLAKQGWQRLVALPWRSAWTWLPLLILFAFLVLRLGGGFSFVVAGQEVSVRSIGNPLLALLWLCLLRALWGRERRRATLARLAAVDRDLQGFLRYTAAPVLFWLLLPPHLRDFLEFVENRSSELPFWSAESLLFYPHAYFESLAPGMLAGAAIVLLAAFGLRRLAGSGSHAFLALWALCGVVAAVVHPYKQDRFFLHAAAALTLLAAITLGGILERLPPRVGRLPALPLLAGLLALAAAAGWGLDRRAIGRDVEARSVPPAVGEVLDAALAASQAEPALLLGTWNLASPWLVEWRAWQASPSWQAPRLPRQPESLVRSRDGAALADRLPAGPPLVLELMPLGLTPLEAAAFGAETAWLEPAKFRLADPTLYAAAPPRDFSAAGYRLAAWRRR